MDEKTKLLKGSYLEPFEIEASDVTSKGQLCNATNLFVQHYQFGFLIVDENVGSKDLYI